MASLKKRSKQYYAQMYIAGKQKRVSLGTSNYQVAKAKLAEIQSQRVRGNDNPMPTKTPLGPAVGKYIRQMQAAKTPGSVSRDIRVLRLLLGTICPEIPEYTYPRKPRPCLEANYIEQMTTDQISEFFANAVRKHGLAPRTANRYREVLNRLFNWSMKQGGVKMPSDRNPAAQVERYRQKAPEIRFLTMRQIDEQLAALADQQQLQTMVALYIYAGLRREEALWLTHDDIDLKAGRFGMIRIQAKTIDGEYWQPKTKKNRAVPISSTLRAYLDAYAPRPSFGSWLFPSPQGRHYDPDNFSRDLRAAQKAASLKWTCLDFRHSFGSHLAMKGESLYKISALMGNSPEICRTHYAALIPEALGDCVEFEAKETLSKQIHYCNHHVVKKGIS